MVGIVVSGLEDESPFVRESGALAAIYCPWREVEAALAAAEKRERDPDVKGSMEIALRSLREVPCDTSSQ
jgi:hypothetical protein